MSADTLLILFLCFSALGLIVTVVINPTEGGNKCR